MLKINKLSIIAYMPSLHSKLIFQRYTCYLKVNTMLLGFVNFYPKPTIGLREVLIPFQRLKEYVHKRLTCVKGFCWTFSRDRRFAIPSIEIIDSNFNFGTILKCHLSFNSNALKMLINLISVDLFVQWLKTFYSI